MWEISMDIIDLSKKSISGKIFNSKTKEPLINAKLTLSVEQNGSTKKIALISNENGIYQAELNGKLKKIEVEYIAYRNLKIDVEKL
ncbi:hypothetical protein SAMN05421823_104138 [Catalinimonas alkaloidigena]|uniref:CarboxypepD_reg-like domain-containing protein n=2 Tax=Catalinimonas alkaloidigena TaxID=1075417 RepID=A0A1G9GK94_9BACT|nr:hypothetical protein SAMN05421823_104138 [Catalinimonas alkaloidigena]